MWLSEYSVLTGDTLHGLAQTWAHWMRVNKNKCIQLADLHLCRAKEYENKKDSMIDMFKDLNHKEQTQAKNSI